MTGPADPEGTLVGPPSHAESAVRGLVDRSLSPSITGSRLSARHNTPWELIHAALGLGPEYQITSDDGRRVKFTDYLRAGAPYFGESTFELVRGQVHVRMRRHATEYEGHPNQFLAYFAEMNLPLSFSFDTRSGQFVLRQLLLTAQRQFNPSEELTFTLIAFAAYMQNGETWTDEFGREYTLEELVSLELGADRSRLSCGGTHSDYALALAREKLRGRSRQILDLVDARLAEDIRRVRTSQRADGSLDFPRGADSSEAARNATPIDKVYTTGHNVEWLVLALPDEEFRAEWFLRAVRYLASELIRCRGEWQDIGYTSHALHGLRNYQSRH